MTRRTAEATIRIPRRAAAVTTTVLIAVAVLAALFGFFALARANEPRTVANAADMRTQQNAAERDIQRAFEQAAGQVSKVRALNLAITRDQADQIATKALGDLKALRHSAFVSLAQVMGMGTADGEAYAAATEQRLDQRGGASPAPSPSPVLLAPRFYTIVSRMSELATQLSDRATTQLTAPSSPAPSPSPSARPSPSPTR